MERKIGVLVVDDSAFMRKALVRMLSSDPMIQVLDTASDGQEAYDKVKKLKPDVVTLDVKMPGMDGLEALKKIMVDCPVPVLMLSSLTSEGGETTLRALDLGAVDVIDKSAAHTAMDILTIAGDLLSKVKAIAGIDASKIVTKTPPRPRIQTEAQAAPSIGKGKFDLLVIGASTGGPPALYDILSHMPADLPVGVLIVQHMPKGFTASLAERMNLASALTISEAHDGDTIRPGRCLIGPSGHHITIRKNKEGYFIRLSEEPSDTLHRPSVDVLMNSVAAVAGNRSLGVLLTGMGSDGALGMKAIHDIGGRTIAQDEETCVVYGMPRVAVELGGVDRSLPLSYIPIAIMEELGISIMKIH